MSNDKAIIGGVVALGLPKPDLMQTDPKKGDYVYGKDEFVAQFGGSGSVDGAVPAPATAEVGQHIVVSAVDENGKATETQAVTFPVKVSNDGYTEITGQRGIVDIAVTEAEDGTVTMVNTLEGGVSETIHIIPDENGNPMTLTYNGVDIPITWTEAGAE